jgi:sterol desaturase/sphingolipid hydroxylase (fatty acid hydroxylase superfamily)
MTSSLLEHLSSLLSPIERVPGFLIRNAIAEWPFLAALGVALSCAVVADLRRGISVRRKYGGPGARIDMLYALLELTHVQALLVLAPVAAGLNAVIDVHAPALRLGLLADAPWWVQLAVSILVIDFIAYWWHRAKHASPWLWQFHKVHHSQNEMTVFTRFRFPLLDRLLDMIVRLLPVAVLTASATLPLVLAFLIALRSCLEHSGHEWTYGPFGRVLVSPMFHGIHHSTARAHRDANFGGFFTFWDRLFGTLAERGDKPLRFGLPHETGANTLFYGATAPIRGLFALARQKLRPPAATRTAP